MAGLFLVQMAVILGLVIARIIERGKCPPVDPTGKFFLSPLEGEPCDNVHREESAWIQVDHDNWDVVVDAPWAARMDEAARTVDRDERFAVLMAAHDEVDKALEVLKFVGDGGRVAAWEAVKDAQDRVIVARAGWRWACDGVCVPTGEKPRRRWRRPSRV